MGPFMWWSKVHPKYRRMVFTGAIIVMGLVARKLHNLEPHMIPIAAILAGLLGAAAGSLIAVAVWSGERLGVWTVPESPRIPPPIRWSKMLLYALAGLGILALIGAFAGVL